MLRINRQTDYAIRVLLLLAQQPEGTRLASAEVGRQMLIPPAFLTRIIAQLAQAELVTTYPGRTGGLELRRPAGQITMKDVVELMEGPMLLSECMLGEEACPFEGDCRVRCRWSRLQKTMLDELEATTFEVLAKESRKSVKAKT